MSSPESAEWSSGWRDATALITHSILAGSETSEVLLDIVAVVQQLSQARQVLVSFSDEHGQDIVEVESSNSRPTLLGQLAPVGDAIIAAPLGEDQGHEMLLTVVGEADGFSPEVEGQILWFTDQVRIALELGATRRANEQLLILEDRDRIARDLHDVVIQRLFGAGMQLDSVQRSLTDNAEAKSKIDNVLSELDTTIKDIRSTIFALRSGSQPGYQTFKDRLSALVEELAAVLGLSLEFVFRGLEQQEVEDQLADDVLAVVREAVTNIAKHSDARQAQVLIRVDEEEIVLVVTQEGAVDATLTGVSVDLAELEASGHSGLVNMRRRAQRYSGTSYLSVVDKPIEVGQNGKLADKQTKLTWNASMLVRRGS